MRVNFVASLRVVSGSSLQSLNLLTDGSNVSTNLAFKVMTLCLTLLCGLAGRSNGFPGAISFRGLVSQLAGTAVHTDGAEGISFYVSHQLAPAASINLVVSI
jgi:hypothetical protein